MAYASTQPSVVFSKAFQILELFSSISESIDSQYAGHSLALLYAQVSGPAHPDAHKPILELSDSSSTMAELFECWSSLHSSARQHGGLACLLNIVAAMLGIYRRSERDKSLNRILQSIFRGDYSTWLVSYLQGENRHDATLVQATISLLLAILDVTEGSEHYTTRLLALLFPIPSPVEPATGQDKKILKNRPFDTLVKTQPGPWLSLLLVLLRAATGSRTLTMDMDLLAPFVSHVHHYLLKHTQFDLFVKVEAAVSACRQRGTVCTMLFDSVLLSRALDVYHADASDEGEGRQAWRAFFSRQFGPHMLPHKTVLLFCRQLRPSNVAIDRLLLLAIFEARQDMYLWIDYWSISPMPLTLELLALCQASFLALSGRSAHFRFKHLPTLFHRSNTTAALLHSDIRLAMLELLVLLYRHDEAAYRTGPHASVGRCASWGASLPDAQAYVKLLSSTTQPIARSEQSYRLIWEILAHITLLSASHQAMPSAFLARCLFDTLSTAPACESTLFYQLKILHSLNQIDYSSSLLAALIKFYQRWRQQTLAARQNEILSHRLVEFYSLLLQAIARGLFGMLDLRTASERIECRQLLGRVLMLPAVDQRWLAIEDSLACVRDTPWTLVPQAAAEPWSSKVAFWHAALANSFSFSLNDIPVVLDSSSARTLVDDPIWLAQLSELLLREPRCGSIATLLSWLCLPELWLSLRFDAHQREEVVLWILARPVILDALLTTNSKQIFDSLFRALQATRCNTEAITACLDSYQTRLAARLMTLSSPEPVLLAEIPDALVDMLLASAHSLPLPLLVHLYEACGHRASLQVLCRLGAAMLQQWQGALAASRSDADDGVLCTEPRVLELLRQLLAFGPACLEIDIDAGARVELVHILVTVYRTVSSTFLFRSRAAGRELACLCLLLACQLERQALSMAHWLCDLTLSFEGVDAEAYFDLIQTFLSACIGNQSRTVLSDPCIEPQLDRLETLLVSEWAPLYCCVADESRAAMLCHIVSYTMTILQGTANGRGQATTAESCRTWLSSLGQLSFSTTRLLALCKQQLANAQRDQGQFVSLLIESILNGKTNKLLRREPSVWHWVLDEPQLWPFVLDWVQHGKMRKAVARTDSSSSLTDVDLLLLKLYCHVSGPTSKSRPSLSAEPKAIMKHIQTTGRRHLLYLYLPTLLSFGSTLDKSEWDDTIEFLWSLYGESLSLFDKQLLASLAQLEREYLSRVPAVPSAPFLPGLGALALSKYTALSAAIDPIHLLVRGLSAKRLRATLSHYSFSRASALSLSIAPEETCYDPLFLAYYTRSALFLVYQSKMSIDWNLVLKMGAHFLLFQFPILALSSLDAQVQHVNRDILNLLSSLLPVIAIASHGTERSAGKDKMLSSGLDWQWAFYALSLNIPASASVAGCPDWSEFEASALPIQCSFYAQIFYTIVHEPESPLYCCFNRYFLQRAFVRMADFGLFYDLMYGELGERGQGVLLDILLRGLEDAESTRRLSDAQWQALTTDRPILDHFLVFFSSASMAASATLGVVTKILRLLTLLLVYEPALEYLVARRKLLDVLRVKAASLPAKANTMADAPQRTTATGIEERHLKRDLEAALFSLVSRLHAQLLSTSACVLLFREYEQQARYLLSEMP